MSRKKNQTPEHPPMLFSPRKPGFIGSTTLSTFAWGAGAIIWAGNIYTSLIVGAEVLPVEAVIAGYGAYGLGAVTDLAATPRTLRRRREAEADALRRQVQHDETLAHMENRSFDLRVDSERRRAEHEAWLADFRAEREQDERQSLARRLSVSEA